MGARQGSPIPFQVREMTNNEERAGFMAAVRKAGSGSLIGATSKDSARLNWLQAHGKMEAWTDGEANFTWDAKDGPSLREEIDWWMENTK